MEQLVEFIIKNSLYAPWVTFGLILLAGFNLPISIDILMVVCAFLAATTIPESTLPLYFSLLFGCYFSAWIAYWIGRKFGVKLQHVRFFSKILNQNRLDKINIFYKKYGLFTLLVGRFIPLGVRNCIFMTSGMSKFSFKKFIFFDAIACLTWTTICFYSFYSFGANYQLLIEKIKILNLYIFLAFSVTLIVFIWYKRKNKKQAL